MKKWVLSVFLVGIVLLLAVSISAKFLLTKDYLVSEIEGSINSRVQIGDVNVSLFSLPAKVSLSDVLLSPRDEFVESGMPHSERAELKNGAIELSSLSFEVSLSELLSRKIYVNHFDLDGLHIRASLFDDGTNSLAPLFTSPVKEKDPDPTPKPEGFNAKDQQEFVTYLKSVAIRNVSFDLLIEKTGLLIQGSECGVEIENIKVDPQALEVVNEASTYFTSKVEVYDSASKTIKYGELGLSGPATARLFDATTGDLDPIVSLDLSISEESHLNTQVPYLKKIWKYGEKLSSLGVSIGSLPERATFGRNRKVAGSYQRGRVDLAEDIAILLHDWEAALNKPSWLASGDETHEFFIDFSASEKSSSSIMKHVDTLVKTIPKEVRGDLSSDIQGDWMKNGKLTLSLHTSGTLSSPKIDLLTELPDIDSLIKDYAKKSALDYLFKKLGK